MGIFDELRLWEIWLKKHHRSAWTSLQNGLSDQEIDDLTRAWGYTLPQEVRELYRWHNGMEDEMIEVIPHMSFYSLERSLELIHVLQDFNAHSPKGIFPKDALPLFGDFQGYHALVAEGGKRESTPLQRFFIQEGVLGYAYLDLTSMIQVTRACCETGVYQIDASGDHVLLPDIAQFKRVLERYSGGHGVSDVEWGPSSKAPLLGVSEDDTQELVEDDFFDALLGMMGVSADDMQLEDFTELFEMYSLEDLPIAFQERYRDLANPDGFLPGS